MSNITINHCAFSTGLKTASALRHVSSGIGHVTFCSCSQQVFKFLAFSIPSLFPRSKVLNLGFVRPSAQ